MRHSIRARTFVVASVFGLAATGLQAGPLGNAITYQGNLSLNGAPVDSSADFEVTLFDAEAGGSPIGSVAFVEDVDVVNGLFTTTLDFGLLAFNGDARWMSIAVRVPHDPTDTAPFTTLTPRQAVTAAPYALFALDGAGGGESVWDLSGTTAFYNDGNVGIGTSTPNAKAEVKGSLVIRNTSTSDDSIRLSPSTGGYGVDPEFVIQDEATTAGTDTGFHLSRNAVWQTSDDTFQYIDASDQASGIHFENNGNINFRTAASGTSPITWSTAMTVTNSTNNIGIGTTAPVNRLDVEGGAVIGATYSGTNTAPTNGLLVQGNVGIGTTAPTDDLEINGSTSTFDTQLLLHNQTNAAGESTGIGFSINNNTVPTTRGALVFERNSTSNNKGNFHFLSDDGLDGITLADSVVKIELDGQVGMGTTAPDSRLNVVEVGDTDTAIHAEHTATTGINYGVYASSTSSSGYGLYATATPTSGTTYGVYGHTGSPNGWGLYANGRVGATGTKSFVIDHPQRPTEEFLLHYCAEGPEPQTVYNGTIKLGADGSAWVKLPDYFEALNADYRYQLTAVGGAAPNLHVAEEVANNEFKIAGGSAGLKVSWQVTARRNDAFVKQYGAPVEMQKNAQERGKYLMPELYGQPEDMGIHYRAPGISESDGR